MNKETSYKERRYIVGPTLFFDATTNRLKSEVQTDNENEQAITDAQSEGFVIIGIVQLPLPERNRTETMFVMGLPRD